MTRNNIWDITNRQQTQIKLEILRKYLKAWAIVIGSYFPTAYFVDCFAGRGRYHLGGQKDNVAGSPIIGLETSLEVKKIKQKKGISFDLKIIAIEPDKDNVKCLKKFAKEADPKSEIKWQLFESEFSTAISSILSKISDAPTFFFIDPYGIKGINKNTLDLIVNRKGSTEIFLNYMKMGVQRIKGQYKNITHKNDKIRIMAIKTISHMSNLFGDMSWLGRNDKKLLTHFVKLVFSKNYRFVLKFDVPYPDRSGIIYSLLFATNYDSGEKIMKSIMTKKLLEGTLFEKCPFNIDWSVK